MKEKIIRMLNDPRRVPVAIGIFAFGAGAGIGYILGKRNRYALVRIVDDQDNIDPSDEIIEIKQSTLRPPPVVIPAEKHPMFNKKLEPSSSPISVIHTEKDTDEVAYHKIIKDDTTLSTIKQEANDKVIDEETETIVEEAQRRTLFAENSEEWNYDVEVKNRNPSLPYIIHRDEFYADEMQYAQLTLTYYAGDNILVDDAESPIYNHETVVGILKFGHGSDDPNVVYVRNDKRRAEYEILLDQGMYSVEVLGLHIDANERARDLKHTKDRKFRPE